MTNTSNSKTEFQWDNELAKEFAEFNYKALYPTSYEINLEMFIKSKLKEAEEPKRIDVNVYGASWVGDKAEKLVIGLNGTLLSSDKFLDVKKVIEEVFNKPETKPSDTIQDKGGWEIVSYINPNIITDIPNGNIEKPNNYSVIRNYTIFSVRRLSDGEVFTVGDKVNCDKCPQSFSEQTIEKFAIADKGFMIASCAGVATSINNISKLPLKEQAQPIAEEVKEYLETLLQGKSIDKTYLRHLIQKISKK